MRKLLLLAVGLCLLIGLQSANAGLVGDLGQCKAYNVNVIAYEKCPKGENSQRIAVLADFISPVSNGDPIAVYLDNKENTILLTPTTDGSFRVQDSNACDANGAILALPDDTADTYYVFVRLVGPPDSTVQHFLCRTDDDVVDTVICQSGAVRTRRTGKGFPAFNNVTNELLTLPGGEQLFDVAGEDYFWVWNTGGKPHAQVWFIDKPCFDAL